mmetsp:Transcript_11802/g.17922  ORF Transcript_11802/g.17922 Transcript_11802/m.17922 type:complete len:523 (-) Transcript_11802:45-1613(-)
MNNGTGPTGTSTHTLDDPPPSASASAPPPPRLRPPPPTYHQLKACQFSSWYYTFRNLHKNPPNLTSTSNNNHDTSTGDDDTNQRRQYPYNNVTIRSIVIKPLPNTFIEYLQTDGITLPVGAENVSSFLPDVAGGDEGDDRNDDDDGDGDDNCEWSTSCSSSASDNEDDNDEGHNQQQRVGEEKSEQRNLDTDIQETKQKNKQDEKKQRKKKKKKKDKVYHFAELNDQIHNALEALGPSIPKLNWSSPKDVMWVNAETMKCSTVGDIYLLLKASDFCTFDLSHALDGIVNDCNVDDRNDNNRDHDRSSLDGDEGGTNSSAFEYELILRKWSNLHASMEFRCFVSNHEIVAISQRNHTQHFPHLKRDYMTIRSHIVDFFEDTIRYTFANGTVHDYVFDVYVDKNDRVWLIDFNLWADRTDALLFQWEELMEMTVEAQVDGVDENDNNGINSSNDNVVNIDNTKPEIRVVMNENEVLYDPLSSYRAPIDTVDLASDNVGSHSFQEFMAMCQRPSAMSDSEDDHNE